MLFARTAIGGLLMGLANLVPGISGGTMLLAVGVYPQFIDSVAQVSTLRIRSRSLLVLGSVVGAALVAVVALAGVVSDLVIHHRWGMYSLFIGLTLGGVPVIWRLVRPADRTVLVTAVLGVGAMGMLALVDPGASTAAASSGRGYVLLLLAGIAGGSAMILPGISGGYVLLILGQYVRILSAIDSARGGAVAGEWTLVTEAMHVFVPFGIGVVVGVVGVSNVVRRLLQRFRRATLGFLLGLLLGAVLGLWPFRASVEPQIGDVVKGVELTTPERVAAIEPKDWPTRSFSPSSREAAGALGIAALGFLVSTAVGRLGAGRPEGGGGARP